MTDASAPADMDALRERLLERIRAGDLEGLQPLLDEVHPSDIADLIESVTEEEARLLLLRTLPVGVASDTLAEMEVGEDRALLLAALAPALGAELLHEMADDDAADLISELEPSERSRILSTLPIEEAGDLQGLLRYGEETAGGRMTTALVSVESTMSAGEAIEEVRRRGREVEEFYTVFVVDQRNHLLGSVSLDRLVVAGTDTPVLELVEPLVATVSPETDQEEVGRLLSRYNLVSIPVINEFEQLLGRVTFDDVLDVIEAEQTEDILRLAGLSDEEEIRGGWGEAVRARLPWLLLNLVTAGMAASVVMAFGATIDALWYLAVIMPIVAGMGGNAGTQALAVTVRGLALATGPLERRFDAVSKEALVGVVNGAALGVAAAGGVTAVAVATGGTLVLGVVVLLAMWGNIVMAGLAGAFIPTVLDRIGIDPAVASSVFVTTLTDLFGFFLLLGLATVLLL